MLSLLLRGTAGAMWIGLQRAGISTCIFDVGSVSKDKLCGGLLTKKTVDMIQHHCPEISLQRSGIEEQNSVAFYYQNEPIIHFSTRIPLYLTERTLLDDSLIKLYRNLGGTVF